MMVQLPVDAIYLFSKRCSPSLGTTPSPMLWLPDTFSSGVHRPGREADQRSLSSAEVKNIRIFCAVDSL